MPRHGGGIQWTRRLLTIAVGVPAALQIIRSDTGTFLLALVICSLCLVEFSGSICPQICPKIPQSTICPKIPQSTLRRLVLQIAGAAVCVAAWTGSKAVHDAVLTGVTISVSAFHLQQITQLNQEALVRLLLDVFALFYIVSGLSHAIMLRYVTPFGQGMQVLGLSCAWICDSGALLAGSLFGEAKLAPVISPGKTIAGAVAGILSSVATVVVAFAGASAQLPPAPLTHQLLVGLLLGVLCILGDLVESCLKRVTNVKDSGTLFPGHGGCLDRMDSFLFVAPCLYFYAHFWFPIV